MQNMVSPCHDPVLRYAGRHDSSYRVSIGIRGYPTSLYAVLPDLRLIFSKQKGAMVLKVVVVQFPKFITGILKTFLKIKE